MDRIGGGPAVRRGLLTAQQAAATVTVGNSTDASAGSTGAGVMWGDFNPASATGVLNTATIQNVSITASYAIFTISPSNVITDISATITTDLPSTSGTPNTIPLPAPLAVNAGDHIGIWISGTTGGVRYAAATGFGRKYITSAITKPTVGATLTPDGTLTDTHWLLAATT